MDRGDGDGDGAGLDGDDDVEASSHAKEERCVCVLYFNLSKNIFLCKFKYRTQTHFKEIKDFLVY